MGKGAPNPLIPATLKDWSIPIGQLPQEGRLLYEFDPHEAARKLLADAGHPSGVKVPLETTPGYGPDWMDAVQVALRNWKTRRDREPTSSSRSTEPSCPAPSSASSTR